MHLEGFFGRGSGKSAAFPHAAQEVLNHALHVNPRAGIVRLEDVGTGGVLHRYFEEEHRAAHVDVPPVLRVAVQGAGTPDLDALARSGLPGDSR